jgi:hypothetical protein
VPVPLPLGLHRFVALEPLAAFVLVLYRNLAGPNTAPELEPEPEPEPHIVAELADIAPAQAAMADLADIALVPVEMADPADIALVLAGIAEPAAAAFVLCLLEAPVLVVADGRDRGDPFLSSKVASAKYLDCPHLHMGLNHSHLHHKTGRCQTQQHLR